MKKKMLVILAHPDDESFGIGGSIAKYAAEGTEVHIAIATDGAAGSVAEGHEDARENWLRCARLNSKKRWRFLGESCIH